jgi:hypothetical protein
LWGAAGETKIGLIELQAGCEVLSGRLDITLLIIHGHKLYLLEMCRR